MTVQRWRFRDPYTDDMYTFFPNPNAMTSPFPERNITTRTVLAVSGFPMLMEGNRSPKEWSFSGDILDADHYEQLRAWVYDRVGRRIQVRDHFGRAITCVLRGFEPVPKRAMGKYWRHTYTINAVVISVGAATIGEVPL